MTQLLTETQLHDIMMHAAEKARKLCGEDKGLFEQAYAAAAVQLGVEEGVKAFIKYIKKKQPKMFETTTISGEQGYVLWESDIKEFLKEVKPC